MIFGSKILAQKKIQTNCRSYEFWMSKISGRIILSKKNWFQKIQDAKDLFSNKFRVPKIKVPKNILCQQTPTRHQASGLLVSVALHGPTFTIARFQGKQEKSSSGKKLELPEKSNFFPLKLFSSNFFLVHIKAVVLADHSF